MDRKPLAVGLVLVGGTLLLGGMIFLRSHSDLAELQRRSPETISTSGPGSPSADSTSRPPSAAFGARSHRVLVALARKTIFERKARWSLGWARSRFLGAPLPKEAEFWDLIAQLKKDLGPEAPSVLGDLVGEATGMWTRELYVALLAGLNDPAAESRLAALASSKEEDIRCRGLAIYGLGLLKTESAWKAALASWEAGDPAGRANLYPGLALFGERAAPFFFKEAETVDFEPGKAHALLQISGAEARGRLWELAESSTNRSIRYGALGALTREPDPATLSRLLDRLVDSHLPSDRRIEQASTLGDVFRRGTLALGESPELLDRLLAHWNEWPDLLKWSLLCDPAVRSAKPEELDRIAPPKSRNDAYIQALLNDPARQGRLVAYAAANPDDDTMMYLMAHLGQTPKLSDPGLVDLVRKETLRFTGDDEGRQYWAWTALRAASTELRGQALEDAARTALQLPGESDRFRLLAGLGVAGPDAAPVALDLLRKETSASVRYELLSTALSVPGRETELQTLARSEIDQILGGVSDPGLRFAAAHPEGAREGFFRFASLIRQVFSAFGTPADIPALRDYASRMVMPEAFGGDKEEYYRSDLQEEILNSIDAIRSRFPDAPGK